MTAATVASTTTNLPHDISEPGFLSWLVDRAQLSAPIAERVVAVQRDTQDTLASVLLKLGLVSEADLTTLLHDYTRFPVWTKPAESFDTPSVPAINPHFLRANQVVPILSTDHQLDVVCWNPLDPQLPPSLEFAADCPVQIHIATRTATQELLNAGYPAITEFSNEDSVSVGSAAEEAELDRLRDLASDAPIIRLLQDLISQASDVKASDIHIEPSEAGALVRFRQDGLLREAARHSADVTARLVSRVKVMASLNIAERRLPQDGRIRVTIRGRDIDLRVATSPVINGESVVLRILDRQDVALDFNALGFDADISATIKEAVHHPFGIVLVTGPTGSGKTTTLYAALKEVNTADRKILTAEDPVEYTLAGVNQVPIRPQIGFTFASALRSFLRQDPDVIMVGEIRDRETADIAVQAALTGHLLLSTLHTNSAAAAVTRLLDMGVDNYLLTSTIRLIVAQRLVRRLCTNCRTPSSPSSSLLTSLGMSSGSEHLWFRAKGCDACQKSGYRGRTSILELLPLTDQLRKSILGGADAGTLESDAIAAGMRTMFAHGLARVAAGDTSVDEVLRVTRLH